MDIQRIAEEFKSPGIPVRARFGEVVSVNDDYTLNVLVGGTVTNQAAEDFFDEFVPMSASGGALATATVDGVDYRTHTFTSAGTFVVTDEGSLAQLDVLIIGGGGGGSGALALRGGGGGGAGRFVDLSVTPTLGSATVNAVGAGGGGGAAGSAGSDGGNTQVTFADASVVIATGGGGGGFGASTGRSGGSGGGNGGTAVSGIGSGNDGGGGRGEQGGGGGAESVGSNGSFNDFSQTNFGGNGGNGLTPSFEFTSDLYAAGGGGGPENATNVQAGPGGAGGGGNGGARSAGSAATGIGCGGGGASGGSAVGFSGGAGSAGVVIFGYRITTSENIVEVEDAELVSNEVEGISYLGHGRPLPGQTVLLLTDGQDLFALDSMARPGGTLSPRRYRTTSQSIPDNTATIVTFGTAVANDLLEVDVSPAGVVSESRMYTKLPGWYQAVGAVEWAANATGWRRVSIRLDSTAVLAASQTDTDDAVATFQTVTTPTFYAESGMWIDMTVQQTSTGALNLTHSSEYVPSLTLTYLGP